MTILVQKNVYVQHPWTEKELIADGFHNYHPIKRITMVRCLPLEEAPKSIEVDGETLIAEAGYWIAYVAGKVIQTTLDDYKPYPIDPDVFSTSYRSWDQPKVGFTATQIHLQQLGCQPYYKFAGMWAKPLITEVWIKGMENDEPVLIPVGAWLCIGTKGEPWSITEEWFHNHYQLHGRRNPNRN